MSLTNSVGKYGKRYNIFQSHKRKKEKKEGENCTCIETITNYIGIIPAIDPFELFYQSLLAFLCGKFRKTHHLTFENQRCIWCVKKIVTINAQVKDLRSTGSLDHQKFLYEELYSSD